MLLGEQAVLTLVAVPVGWAIGYWLCFLMVRSFEWELFRMPLVVSAQTFAFSLAVILLAALGSALLVRRRIDRLDLVEVLKTRE